MLYTSFMELSQKQKEKIAEIAQKYHLKLVLLFGSQAIGRAHKESDVDVAFLPETDLDFDTDVMINYEFTNTFGTDKVDTVNLRTVSPLLFYGIFQAPQVLFAKDEVVFPGYRAYAFKKYVETKPLYAEKFRRLKEKIKKIKI